MPPAKFASVVALLVTGTLFFGSLALASLGIGGIWALVGGGIGLLSFGISVAVAVLVFDTKGAPGSNPRTPEEKRSEWRDRRKG